MDDRRELGVGFVVRNTLLSMTEPPSGSSERILTLLLSMIETPTGGSERILILRLSTSSGKDKFYGALDHTIGMLTPSEHIYLLGDFNARVGAKRSTWQTCKGYHCVGKINENERDFLSYAVLETSV